MNGQLTTVVEKEGDGYVALCPEVDVASQGTTIDEARSSLNEALELFFETASVPEIESRLNAATPPPTAPRPGPTRRTPR